MKLIKSEIAIAFFAVLIILAPIFPQSGQTQQQKPPQDKNKRDDDAIRIDTDLVTLTTTVVNERGRYVADLRQRDFAIYEDGVKQEVAYFNTGDKVPISLGVLFDTSGSLQRVAEGKHNRRALMLVTDGNDTSSSVSLETTLNLARKSEVIIYALGIGHGESGSFGHGDHDRGGIIFGRQIKDEIDMNVLRQFAETTGGEAFHLESPHAGGRDLVDEAAAQNDRRAQGRPAQGV